MPSRERRLTTKGSPRELDVRGGLTAFEVVSGVIVGRGHADQSVDPPVGAPHLELEAALEHNLTAGPCAVSFSGGVDSSLVLSAAYRTADRLGVRRPVPVTLRWSDSPDSYEDEWQRMVLEHLGAEEHVVINVGADLDLVGPVAQPVLRRLGIRFAPQAFSNIPILERYRNATILTGAGGDGVLGGSRWSSVLALPAAAVLRSRRAALRAAIAPFAPARLALSFVRPDFDPPEWLHPPVRRRARWLASRWSAGEHASWSGAVLRHANERSTALVAETLALVAEPYGSTFLHPLLNRRVVRSIAEAGGWRGFASRGEAVQELFPGLLPDAIATRADKADFTVAYMNSHTRAFAERWSGEGIDPTLVDTEVLRRTWLAELPDFRSASALQAAWLATEGGRTN